MFDLWMVAAFLAHGAGLVGLALFACSRWRIPLRDRPFVVGFSVWSAFVLAGHGASLGGWLGSLSVYAPLSLVALGVVFMALTPVLRSSRASLPLMRPVSLSLDMIASPRARRTLFWFLGGTLALFAVASVALGFGVYPDNADSIIYRLPRPFWYVSNGSFLHPFESIDKRLVFYPLNGVALYVPLVLYGLPGTFHCVPSLIAWSFVLYATYRFARALGADRLLSLFSAWLIGLTPGVLAQAISTNDEILAAAAFVSGLFMFWRWLETGKPLYFLVFGASLALSAGTKLHIVFLMPMIALVVGGVFFKAAKDKTLLPRVWGALGAGPVFLTLAFMAVLFLPFLFYNHASVGRWYFVDDFKEQVFNLSGHLRVGFQNLLIYFSQMILSPVADLNFWPDTTVRQKFNLSFNAVFDPLIRPFIVNNPSFFHMDYRFVGVTIPVSVRFVEFSLWSAFVWLLWPWQTALALAQKTPARFVLFVIAATPLLWLLIWSFSTLYMEGTATYFTFYLICAAPAAVTVFGALRSSFLREMRWVFVLLVALGNLIVSHNLVMYSGFRAIPDLFHAPKLPYDWLHFDEKIVAEIRKAQRIRVVFTHEKMPYFAYMHRNPRAKYLSPYNDGAALAVQEHDKTLQIFPISALNLFGFMPVKIPGKTDPGLTFLGLIRGIGREIVFGIGNGIERRHLEQSDYIVFQAHKTLNAQTGGKTLSMGREVLGLSPNDRLSFEYEVTCQGRTLFRKERSPEPFFTMELPAWAVSPFVTVIVSSTWSGKEIARATYAVDGPGSWLPEGGEYN